MRISATTLLTTLLASPAFAHADAHLHTHGIETGPVLAATGLVLAAAATGWWALLR